MALTVAQLVTAVEAQLRDTALDDYVYNWINAVQEDMDRRTFWNHLEATPHILPLVASYTTGTATATNGSATVTGSGTTWTTGLHAGQLIRFGSEDNYYLISSVGGTTSITLTSNYIGTTGSGKTYAIHTYKYSLPTDCHIPRIRAVTLQNPFQKLTYLDQARRERYLPNLISSTGRPWAYTDWGGSTIQPVPLADGAYNVVIRYQKFPTEVAAGSTSFDWPAQMHRCLLKGTEAQGWMWKDDPGMYSAAKAEYEAMLAGHIADNNKKGDNYDRMEPFDAPGDTSPLAPPQLGRNIED